MAMTDWCELKMLQALVEEAPEMYLALFTAAPSAGGTGGTEVSGAGYVRQLIPFGDPATDEDGNTFMANASPFTFPRAESDWGQIAAWGVFDAETDGHLLWFQEFEIPQAVLSGQAVAVREGNVTLAVE
jgi:hypothetical protein